MGEGVWMMSGWSEVLGEGGERKRTVSAGGGGGRVGDRIGGARRGSGRRDTE